MTARDFFAILPLILPAGAAVVVLVAAGIRRRHPHAALFSTGALGLSVVVLPWVTSVVPRGVTPILIVDGYTVFFWALLNGATFAVALLSFHYLEKGREHREEFYMLLLLAVLGADVLVASRHFAAFFLGIETLSVSLYGLIAYPHTTRRSVEAGLKYVILAGASSATLLFGMALVYAATGTLVFSEFANAAAGRTGGNLILLAGLALMLVGIGFKLAWVPFHMWTPDVYAAAPAPVTAFIATVSKGAVFAILMRIFVGFGEETRAHLGWILGVLAVASMFAGNLLALLQNNLKRILAYSSVAHLGYLLVALLSGGDLALRSMGFYLAAYMASTLSAFGVVTVLSAPEHETDSLDEYRGLARRRPGLSLVLMVSLFSLAGLPLTAGFVAKFYILAAGIQSSLWTLAVLLALSSVIGLFYYLRVVVVMVAPAGDAEPEGRPAGTVPATASVVLGLLLAMLIWFGVYPVPLERFLQATVARLF